MECTEHTAIVVDSLGIVGDHTSITIGANGFPLIAYYDETKGDLKVATCTNHFCSSYFRRR